MPDPEENELEPDPADSLIRRAKKKMDDSKLIEAVVRWGVIAALGTGAGMASHKVGDAHEDLTHEQNKAQIELLRQELREFQAGMLSRVETEEKERLAAERAADERRHSREEYRERRFTRIEGKLGIEAPPSVAEAPPN